MLSRAKTIEYGIKKKASSIPKHLSSANIDLCVILGDWKMDLTLTVKTTYQDRIQNLPRDLKFYGFAKEITVSYQQLVQGEERNEALSFSFKA